MSKKVSVLDILGIIGGKEFEIVEWYYARGGCGNQILQEEVRFMG